MHLLILGLRMVGIIGNCQTEIIKTLRGCYSECLCSAADGFSGSKAMILYLNICSLRIVPGKAEKWHC